MSLEKGALLYRVVPSIVFRGGGRLGLVPRGLNFRGWKKLKQFFSFFFMEITTILCNKSITVYTRKKKNTPYYGSMWHFFSKCSLSKTKTDKTTRKMNTPHGQLV